MIFRRIKEKPGQAFVQPLIFAMGFLVLTMVFGLFGAIALSDALGTIALIIIALDLFTAGIIGTVWFFTDKSKPS